jgi:hypothetical protein
LLPRELWKLTRVRMRCCHWLRFSSAASILVIIASLVGAIALVVLSTLGGVIGTAIFEKRKGDGLTPPPPQNFA